MRKIGLLILWVLAPIGRIAADTVYPSVESCIDYPNLTAATCYIGTAQATTDYSKVMTNATVQLVDYGYADHRSRHTVISDTTIFDSNTNNALRCVPSGELYAVRLGSRYSVDGTDYTHPGMKAQRIEYPYTVSPKGSERLAVRYAMVCNATVKGSGSWVEDEEEQPKFFVRVMNGNTVIASRNLSPSQANSGNAHVITDPLYGSSSDYKVIWYNWDSIVMDMDGYAGRTLTFEITTSDCTSSHNASHFCYAYFTIGCTMNAVYQYDSDTVCYTPYAWHGRLLTTSGTYVDTVVNDGNINDTIYTLSLEMHRDTTVYDAALICEGQTYDFNGRILTEAGVYTDSLTTSWGCDSVIVLTLDVDTNLVYSKWTDLIFCDNGQDRWVSYQWYRDGVAIPGATMQYLYLPDGMGTSEYYVQITDTLGMQYVTCPRTFDDTPRSADQYGTVSSSPERIHIVVPDAQALLQIYSACGQLLWHDHISYSADLTIPLPPGIYTLYLSGASGSQTHKIAVP